MLPASPFPLFVTLSSPFPYTKLPSLPFIPFTYHTSLPLISRSSPHPIPSPLSYSLFPLSSPHQPFVPLILYITPFIPKHLSPHFSSSPVPIHSPSVPSCAVHSPHLFNMPWVEVSLGSRCSDALVKEII